MRPQTNEATAKDIFRDTPIRLLGYANEVGEAFRPLVHRNVVRSSYGVAFSYCTADTLHKATITSKKETVDEKGKKWIVLNSAIDAFVWQTLASVIIPGLTINRICWASLRMLTKYSTFSVSANKWTAAATSIASIPFIVKPIDLLVDKILNNTLRLYTRTE